jgi:hypothetical protein
VTLCVNAGFYLGAGNQAISSVAFPWLLSIEAFAGARIVLNLHALPFDASTDGSRTTGGGALSSHIVFTPNSGADHPRNNNVRWDWGGVQQESSSSDSRSGGTRMGIIEENYEMTSSASASTSDPGASFNRKHRPAKSASNCTSHSDTCIEEEGVA